MLPRQGVSLDCYENVDQESHRPWLKWVHLEKSPASRSPSFPICKTG